MEYAGPSTRMDKIISCSTTLDSNEHLCEYVLGQQGHATRNAEINVKYTAYPGWIVPITFRKQNILTNDSSVYTAEAKHTPKWFLVCLFLNETKTHGEF